MKGETMKVAHAVSGLFLLILCSFPVVAQHHLFQGKVREQKGQTPNSLPPHTRIFIPEVPPGARRAYEHGVSKLKEGRTDEGIASLREAIKIHPNYFSAQLTLAGELGKGADLKGALDALEVARRINDSDARVYQLFGTLMAREKKYGVAEFAFREAIQRDPKHAQSYLSLATVLIELASTMSDKRRKLSDLVEAERLLNKSLELSDQKLAAAYLQMARIHERQGNRKQAASDLQTYLRLQPDDKNAASIREAIAKLNK
jgi:tetratricopeptide (TPR) repeat protein